MLPKHWLPFEKDICQMEELLARLEADPSQQANGEQIRGLRKELAALKRNVYANLAPWDTVQVSRHPERPQCSDYVHLIFDEFVELHGDRAIGDDRAILTGFARLGYFRVMLNGQQKGHHTKERLQ
jgi:acetyl-CoA carboxylase carboxyl transferase subunit alpha